MQNPYSKIEKKTVFLEEKIMLNIAICDDDDLIAHQMESVLHNIGNEENVKIDTDVFYSGNDLVREISSGKKFDLIYMDIQMENGDGITAAKNIRKKDEDAMIIFISSYDRYVMELFRLDVFSFIRKPIDRDSFVQIFLEANQRICSRNHFFSFKYKSQEYKVLCKEILYFESKARQINIYVRDGNKYVFNGKLSEVEKGLSSGKVTFLRIHQSYLVNYLLIKSRSKSNVTLINGEVLPISEDRTDGLDDIIHHILRNSFLCKAAVGAAADKSIHNRHKEHLLYISVVKSIADAAESCNAPAQKSLHVGQ